MTKEEHKKRLLEAKQVYEDALDRLASLGVDLQLDTDGNDPRKYDLFVMCCGPTLEQCVHPCPNGACVHPQALHALGGCIQWIDGPVLGRSIQCPCGREKKK